MNKIVICGRLTKDPELRTTNNGTEVCGFTVAVDRRIKKNSEKETDFIDCTAWEKTGVFVNTYFHKGDGITVEGRICLLYTSETPPYLCWFHSPLHH